MKTLIKVIPFINPAYNHIKTYGAIILKKILIFILCFLLLITPLGVCGMELSAQSAILIEAETGRVLYSKNSGKRMGMASTTKIMTALVALDKYNPADIITASYKAANTEGSSIYLKSGEKMSLEHVLYGLMLASGNDAAVAIAEHIGKNEYTFAQYMNNKAINLGLKDTHFENPNGLSHENHYTTAYDLAMITREAMKNEIFREIVSTKNKVLKSLSGENDRYIKNHNKLLWQYENCVGVKTGFTKKDGRCLVSAATKNNVNLIAVTLNAPNDWSDHEKMLDYGFDYLKNKKIINTAKYAGNVYVKNGIVDNVECIFAKDFSVSLNKDDKLIIKKKFISSIDAPVKKGDTAGYAEIYINGVKIGEVDILTNQNVDLTDKNKFIRQFTSMLLNLI